MCEDKRKIIAYLWYLSALLSIAYVITAIAVAVRNNVSTSGNKAAGFAAIWSMFILVLIVVGGTFTMKKLKTPIATGVFLGASIMFSQMELLLFALFVGLAQTAVNDTEKASDQAMAIFAFFLFVLYGIFSTFLFLFRHYVIEDNSQPAENNYA